MSLQSTPQGVVRGSIPLFAGHPAPELLPLDGFQRTVDAVWDDRDITRLFNYGDEQGDGRLIEFLVARLNRTEGLGISRENLMIIGGSTWGVDMISGHLTDPGDVILVDSPSYRDALYIFRDHQLEMVSIAIDEGGAIVAEMERTLRLLAAKGKQVSFYYVVPNFQNPTGITMPEARRRAIIELSRQYGFTIVEDEVYTDIRFGIPPPPSFYALAQGENVLRLGTFSKTLAPGLRIGWLIASSDWISRFVDIGLLRMGGGANPFSAGLVADYCHSGAWEVHVEWVRGQYEQRRDIALAALESSMPAAVEWTRPEGGYFIWLRLPESVLVDELERLAREQNVYFATGKFFFVNPEDGASHLRISYSFVSPEDLRSGIEILGSLIGQLTE